MFDARYFAFAALSALLVISPGATLAVVVETALGYGRRAALLTVAGVGLANATLAASAAVGFSAIVERWPPALQMIRLSGGLYLACLGLRSVWRPFRVADAVAVAAMGTVPAAGEVAETEKGPVPITEAWGFVGRGLLTNLLNPPVVLFYLTVVPQFIGPQDSYVARALVLGATHVAMSILWQGSCGLAVDVAAEHMRRPAVRRTLERITGVVLVLLGARLLFQ